MEPSHSNEDTAYRRQVDGGSASLPLDGADSDRDGKSNRQSLSILHDKSPWRAN